MKLNEKIHISLAIDSENNTSFDIDLNENLDILCPNIAKKYNLSQAVEKNLKIYIENFISEEIKKENDKKKILRRVEKMSVQRLYNQSLDDARKKKDCLKKLKEEKFNEFVNKFPFKPKILYFKNYERNYYKIEDKLIEDGKKSNEKKALKRIANEINNSNNRRNKEKDIKKVKIENSSLQNNEKKQILTNDSINLNTNSSKNNTKPFNLIDSNQTPANNILIDNQIKKNIHPNHLTNTPDIIIDKFQPNTNYQLLVMDENSKIINNPTPKFQFPNTSLINNPNLRNSIGFRSPKNNKISSNNVLQTEQPKNTEYINKRRDTQQSNKSNFSNSINLNSLVNTLRLSNSSNKKYSNQYLKQKNNNDNIIIESRSSSRSQKKNDSSTLQSQDNVFDVKSNKDLILDQKNSTSNQLIKSYQSKKKLNSSISFKHDSNQSKESIYKSNSTNMEKVFIKKVIKKSGNFKKNVSNLTNSLDYRFKDKRKDNESHKSIYEISKDREKAKKDHYEHLKLLEFSYKPTLTEGSRKILSKSLTKYENKEQFFTRLTNSKYIKNLSISLKKRNKSVNSTVWTEVSNKNVVKRSYSYKSTLTNKNIKTTEETDQKSSNFALTDESIRIREAKKNKELMENINLQRYKEKTILKDCSEMILDNINKFKLNNLKEIFEIIYNNCSNIDDIENIEKYGINSKIKDKLILPTCHRMKEENLEFNFQNFFLISNEIIDVTIDDKQ